MAAVNYYTVIIQETAPSSPQFFWIWIQPSGQAWIYLSAWTPLVSAEAFTVGDGIFWRRMYDQTSAPATPYVGDMWLDDTGQCYIYTGTWVPMVGG